MTAIRMTEAEYKKMMKDSNRYYKEPPSEQKKKKSKGKTKRQLNSLQKDFERLASNQVKLEKQLKDSKKKKKKPFSLDFRPKDYVKGITQKTATLSGTRGGRSRNGLRSEFTSRGYTGESGFPELDNKWGRATRTEAFPKSNIVAGGRVRSEGSLIVRGRTMPNINDVASGIGGDPILPKVRRVKGRVM